MNAPHRNLPPRDFETVYVQQGRLACEAYFKANRNLVSAWMRACGKQRLIDERAAYVAQQRSNGEWMTRQTPLIEHHEIKRPTIRESIRDKRKVPFIVARQAAHHLRIVRNGGFIVSPSANGDWWVGSRRLSAAQMVDLARSKGFEDQVVVLTSEANLQGDGDEGVKS